MRNLPNLFAISGSAALSIGVVLAPFAVMAQSETPTVSEELAIAEDPNEADESVAPEGLAAQEGLAYPEELAIAENPTVSGEPAEQEEPAVEEEPAEEEQPAVAPDLTVPGLLSETEESTAPGEQSQKEPPAETASLTIGQQIASDNGELVGITPVELAYKTATKSQDLEVSLSLPFWEGADASDSVFDLREPQALLHYRRFTKNSSFETRLTYRETDLDREIYFDQSIDEIVTQDDGSLAERDFLIGYAFGNEGKIGGEFTLGYRDRNYSGTIDPDLYDLKTLDGDAVIYLEPTPLIRARVLTSVTKTDSYGEGTDTKNTRIGAGAAVQVDKLTNIDAELAWSEIQRDNLRDMTEENTNGLSVRLRAERARPNGLWSLAFSSDPGTDGRRERLTFGRNLEMRRYELSASVGATRFDGNYDPVFEIGYNREFREGAEFNTTLRQEAVTDNDGDEALNTYVTAGYRHNLTKVSNIDGNIRYRASKIQTGDNDDAESIAFDVNYNHVLTNDFSLVAGATLIKSSSGDNNDETDDKRVYLGINRKFDFLP